jgi:probable rRNA maturation factor
VSARTRSSLARADAEHLARAVLSAEGVRDAILSITFVGRQGIRSLNRRHLGQDSHTDVLAFALQDGTRARGQGRTVVGDVYVCAPVGVGQARRFGARPVDELRRLLVHGVLHVLGYDHPGGPRRTTSAMWRRQEQLLARLGGRR